MYDLWIFHKQIPFLHHGEKGEDEKKLPKRSPCGWGEASFQAQVNDTENLMFLNKT